MVGLFEHRDGSLRDASIVDLGHGDDRLARRVWISLDEDVAATVVLERKRVGVEVRAVVGKHGPTSSKISGLRDPRAIVQSIANTPEHKPKKPTPNHNPNKTQQQRGTEAQGK